MDSCHMTDRDAFLKRNRRHLVTSLAQVFPSARGMELEEFFGMIRQQVQFEVDRSENETYNETWIHTDFIERYPYLTIPYLVVLSLATAMGTIGNVLVIGGVLVSARLRTTGNMFIVNLALADLVVTTMVFPFCLVGVIGGPKFFLDKVILCHVVAGICLPSCVCSLWNMAGIALNRYMFLCRNHQYGRIYTRCTTLSMCFGLWVTSFVVMEMPILLGWGAHNFDMKTMMCSYSRLASYAFTLYFCLFAIGTPMVLVFLCYLRIYLYVRASQRRLKVFSLGEPRRGKATNSMSNMEKLIQIRKKEEIQLARTLFLVFFVYFFCWTPYACVVLSDPDDKLPMVAHVIVVQLGHGNSSLNSIIYGYTNKQFRDGYKKFLGLFCQAMKRFNRKLSRSQHTETMELTDLFATKASVGRG